MGSGSGTGPNQGVSPAAFVAANTILQQPSHVPELLLHLADEALPLWQLTEDELDQSGLPPPFWAFAWAGGQALARHILDNPDLVAGRSVLDVGAGGGIAAIAAAKAGATTVRANEIDEFALAAIALNAAANSAVVEVVRGDLLDGEAGSDIVIAGDIFYEAPLAKRAMAFLRRAELAGALVLIGDPKRTYLPTGELREAASFKIKVPKSLEDQDVKRTAVWTLA